MKNIMETLELKHIIPYGLHRLRIHVSQKYKEEWNGILTDIDFSSRSIKIEGKGEYSHIWRYISLSYCKPYYHPLSDLTKEMEHNGEKFVMMKIIRQKALDEHFIAKEQWSMLHFLLTDNSTFKKNLPFWVIELLVKYHFWIFDQEYFNEGIVLDINKFK